jgi:hypothetical protein
MTYKEIFSSLPDSSGARQGQPPHSQAKRGETKKQGISALLLYYLINSVD